MLPEVASPPHHELVTERSSVQHDVKAPQQHERGTTKTRTTKRSIKVSFNKGVRVYHHIHLNDFSDDEVMNTWFMDEDTARINAECALTVNLLSVLSSPSSRTTLVGGDNQSPLCFRGLEYRTQDGANNRRENKSLGWDTVLHKQECQYRIGEHDDESIARAYREATGHCAVAASLIGLADAQVVRQQEEAKKEIVSMKESCDPIDKELSSYSTMSHASLQVPKRRKMMFRAVSISQRASSSGKQSNTAT